MMTYFKDFDGWNTKKKTIDRINSKPPLFKEREIWWISVGVNVGYEEDGKGKDFARPVLVLKKFNKELFIGVPLSTKIKSNQYYFRIIVQGEVVSAITSQIKAFSSKRFLTRIEKLEKEDFNNIRNEIGKFFILPLSPKRESRA